MKNNNYRYKLLTRTPALIAKHFLLLNLWNTMKKDSYLLGKGVINYG